MVCNSYTKHWIQTFWYGTVNYFHHLHFHFKVRKVYKTLILIPSVDNLFPQSVSSPFLCSWSEHPKHCFLHYWHNTNPEQLREIFWNTSHIFDSFGHLLIQYSFYLANTYLNSGVLPLTWDFNCLQNLKDKSNIVENVIVIIVTSWQWIVLKITSRYAQLMSQIVWHWCRRNQALMTVSLWLCFFILAMLITTPL